MKKNVQSIIISLAIALLALAMVGCGIGPYLQAEDTLANPNGAVQENEANPENIEGIDFEKEDQISLPYERYTIPTNETDWTSVNYWTIDRDGNTINKDEQYDVLYDVMTGEPQCLVRTDEVANGKDEYGNVTSTTFSALFDLDETLLHDWEECRYVQGFGNFVIRRTGDYYNLESSDGIQSVLWNFKTGAAHTENVFWTESLSENEALMSDGNDNLIGVVDKSGTMISEVSYQGQYVYARAWNDYILARTVGQEGEFDKIYLLNEALEPLLSYSTLQESWEGKVLYYEDRAEGIAEAKGIINVSGEELYRLPQGESVSYFNENVAITFSDNSTLQNHRIINLKTGTVLSEGEGEVVCNMNIENGKHNELFLIITNSSLQVLDTDGWRSEVKDVQGANFGEILNNGFIRIMTNSADDSYSDMLLDSELNVIVPSGVYDYIRQVSKWSGGKEYFGNALICEKYQNNNFRSSIDILDPQGNILVEGLNAVYDSGPNRLAVRKGFDMGLMDWQGNWIVKRSIFSELQD